MAAAANHSLTIYQLLASLPLPHKLKGVVNTTAAVHAAYLDLANHFLPPHFIHSNMNDAAATERLCGLLLANGTRVALVGNGPLGDGDRTAINAAPTVVRFNNLVHKRNHERFTLWVITTSQVQASAFPKVSKLATGARAALLFSNPDLEPANELEAAEQLLNADGQRGVEVLRYSWDNPFVQRVGELLNMSGIHLTTGFSMLNLVLHCLPPEGRVDLFGFSFTVRPDTIVRGIHSGDMEAAVVRLAQHMLPDRLRINETPCVALRVCHRPPPHPHTHTGPTLTLTPTHSSS